MLPICGRPILSSLAPLGRWKSINVGAPISGWSGLSLLLSQAGNRRGAGCIGACRGGSRGRDGGPEAQRGPSRRLRLQLQLSPTPPGAHGGPRGAAGAQSGPAGRGWPGTSAESRSCPLSAPDRHEEDALPLRVRTPSASMPAAYRGTPPLLPLPGPPRALCFPRGSLVTVSWGDWFGERDVYRAQGTVAPPE